MVVAAGASDPIARNREAFRLHHPRVWAVLESLPPPSSRLVVDGDGKSNIDLGGTLLYPKPAEDWTAEQLDLYFAQPDRIGFANPSNCNLSPVSKRLLEKVRVWFADHGPRELSPYPLVDVGFAFLLGVGLGWAVREFVARDLARTMVLVEPIPELLLHSLAVVDWATVFEEAKAKEIDIFFVLGKQPNENVQTMEAFVQFKGQTFIEGSYAFLGYYSWAVAETRRLLNEKLQVHFLSSGFFEDELLMMGNTYGNLSRYSFRTIARRPYLEQKVPVFVVGSGPSLDADMEYIKKWRDRVILFSCGTSLGILLKNGLRPDLHNENENTPQLVKNLEDFHVQYGFQGITLVASTTVNPRVAALFERRWFYMRGGLSSSLLLHGGMEPIRGAAPLVANAAFAAMATMGFREVYLFGVDCGRRRDAGHHAKDAVYYGDDYDNYLPGESFELLETEFDRPVPGNFGGEALTTWYLDMSRASFTAVQGLFKADLFNCSNGARIDGAKPRHAASLSFRGAAGAAMPALALAERQLPAFAAGEFLDRQDLERHRDGHLRFAEAFGGMIDDALREDEGFMAFETRLLSFLDEKGKDFEAVLVIIKGTLRSMVRLGAFGGTRIADPGLRREFLRFFLEHYRKACLWMAGEAGIVMNEIVDRRTDLTPVGENQPE